MDLLSDTNNPPIIDDICVTKDEFGGKIKYFMASNKKSQFFKLSEIQYNFFSIFLPYALTEHNIVKLEKKCQEISDGKVSYSTILKMLDKYDLYDNKNKEIKSKVAIDYNSKKFIEIPLEHLNSKKSLWIGLYNVIFVISAVIIFVSVIEMLFNYRNIFHIIDNIRFSMDSLSLNAVIVVLLISSMSIFLHELGHLLMSQKLGIKWKSINISFVWGLSPIFYVRYINFCIYKSKDKIKVLSMGIFMNFVQVLLFLQLSIATNNWIFMVGVLVNAGCIISCIMPLGTSDGYQILAILLGLEGARWKALTMIGQIFKRPKEIKLIIKNKEDMLFIIYILAAYITSIWGCVELLKLTLNFFNLLNVTNSNILIFVMLFFGISTCINMVKLIRNVSNIK